MGVLKCSGNFYCTAVRPTPPTLQALFAVPPVQLLYEKADLSGLLPGGDVRDDQRIGEICIANVYREARSATRKLQPMYPQDFLDRFSYGMQEDASHFHMFSNSHICFAPRLLGLLEGVDGPLGKCGACAHERQLTREEWARYGGPGSRWSKGPMGPRVPWVQGSQGSKSGPPGGPKKSLGPMGSLGGRCEGDIL